MLRRIAVLGSGAELAGPDELVAAQRVGRLLGENAIALVYDGSATGALGAAADAVAAAGGRLVGILTPNPTSPRREDLAERHETTTDGWRGTAAARADAWIALPGALTRLEDALALFDLDAGDGGREAPLGLLDDAEYYSGLLRTASDGAVDRFVLESQRGRLVVARNAAELLRRLADYRPPETRRDRSDGFDDSFDED